MPLGQHHQCLPISSRGCYDDGRGALFSVQTGRGYRTSRGRTGDAAENQTNDQPIRPPNQSARSVAVTEGARRTSVPSSSLSRTNSSSSSSIAALEARDEVVPTDESAPWVPADCMASLLGIGTRTDDVESEVESDWVEAGSSLRTRIANGVSARRTRSNLIAANASCAMPRKD